MVPIEIVTAVLAALTGALFPLTKDLVLLLRNKHRGEQFFASSFGQVLLGVLGLGVNVETPDQLFGDLSQASQKLDAIVSRIQTYAKMRESTVSELDARLEKLSTQEGQLRVTIEQLQQVPLPAAERFAAIVRAEEKRSAVRDYVLFVSGVIVTEIATIVLKHFHIG